MLTNISDEEALQNIYDYIVQNKNTYTFEMEGIHFMIKCDCILKVVEIYITGHEMQIMVNDGVDFYTETIRDKNYAKKFIDLIQSEYEHTEKKHQKYSKSDRRHFYSIAKKLKK